MRYGELILVDVDEVMIHSNHLVIAAVNAEFGTDYREDEVSRYAYPNITEPEHRAAIPRAWARDDLYDDREPEPGAIEGWAALCEIGHPIVVSKLTRGHHESKDRWLHDVMGLHEDRIVYIADKTLIRAPILIDDAVHHLEVFGGAGIVFDRPWNQHWTGARAHDWPEVVSLTKAFLRET